MKPILSIIIVNYNGKKYIENCLISIREKISTDHEVIVVDNNSTDGSLELALLCDNRIKIIKNDLNVGFAKANNIGYASAQGAYVLLLNNDTIILNDVMPAIEMMVSDPKIKIVGGRMLGPDLKYRFSCGNFPSVSSLVKFSNLFRKEGLFEHGDFPPEPSFYKVDWVEGSFLLTTSENYSSLGGLDENYFMYVEDVDFCKRTSLSGGAVVYFHEINYVHYGGFSHARTKYIYDGYFKYISKFYTGRKKLFYKILLTTKIKILKIKLRFKYLLSKDQECYAKLQDLIDIETR